MNITKDTGFEAPNIKDVIDLDGGVIVNPGGSQGGWYVGSIGPGLDVYVFPDGEEVVVDEVGNILG